MTHDERTKAQLKGFAEGLLKIASRGCIGAGKELPVGVKWQHRMDKLSQRDRVQIEQMLKAGGMMKQAFIGNLLRTGVRALGRAGKGSTWFTQKAMPYLSKIPGAWEGMGPISKGLTLGLGPGLGAYGLLTGEMGPVQAASYGLTSFLGVPLGLGANLALGVGVDEFVAPKIDEILGLKPQSPQPVPMQAQAPYQQPPFQPSLQQQLAQRPQAAPNYSPYAFAPQIQSSPYAPPAPVMHDIGSGI